MAKYVGLDLGSKTIGIAVSEGYFANSKETIKFLENDFNQAVNLLNSFLKKETFEKVIIGYPKNMDGTIGHRVEMVENFIDIAVRKNVFSLNDIIKVDERLTTKMAKSIMISANLSRQKQKENKDQFAAKLILETFLNTIK
ncbi:Holliday junction resolvase RuvX [Spiroplasma taiwanense]|uniref:Putative pre-16S rRNA nuclease n=1 Tax=Spiroplasma taiwanense CT-1 TaxID=1276220 RepID=S5MGA2_9MOLU|nr:Holliday junction resolvase RuvX [Spiroplasma taiwanense]AGR40890.1 Holliday junction resolvase-like protein [Spiroplasma taiwanense CT-1]